MIVVLSHLVWEFFFNAVYFHEQGACIENHMEKLGKKWTKRI